MKTINTYFGLIVCLSHTLFLSLQMSRQSITLNRTDTEPLDIEFTLTVPFGCTYFENNEQDAYGCYLAFEVHAPSYHSDDCSGNFVVQKCRFEIQQKNWNRTQTFIVKWQDTDAYSLKNNVFLLQMITTIQHGLWSNVLLPEIKVGFLLN